MEVANAYFQLGQYQQSIFRLESLINDDDYGKRAQALLSEIDRLSLVKASFPLVKQSAHYLIDAQLNNHQITLLIDTGASISVLSEWFFEKKESQFNAEFVRHATIDTAGGRVEAPIYRFENFAIGEYRVRDIEFVVMALSQNNSASQGLLGMNFLKNFAFNLDQDKQQLILQPRD
jgi:clan AA aspartic protease (TIGR02281 family)